MNCKHCDKELSGKQEKFCSRSCLMKHNKTWKHQHDRSKTNGKQCVNCETNLIGNQKMFCSTKCKFNYRKEYYNKKSYQKQQERGLNRKLSFIDKLGGKCQSCGYDKNASALVFHHKNENTKSFQLDIRYFSNKTLSALEEEVNKCMLLCHNCHSEHHYPHMEMNSLRKSS